MNIDYEVLVQPEADLSKEIDEAFGLKGLVRVMVSVFCRTIHHILDQVK